MPTQFQTMMFDSLSRTNPEIIDVIRAAKQVGIDRDDLSRDLKAAYSDNPLGGVIWLGVVNYIYDTPNQPVETIDVLFKLAEKYPMLMLAVLAATASMF